MLISNSEAGGEEVAGSAGASRGRGRGREEELLLRPLTCCWFQRSGLLTGENDELKTSRDELMEPDQRLVQRSRKTVALRVPDPVGVGVRGVSVL